MKKSSITLVIIGLVVLIAIISSVYVVREDEVAVLSTFGKINSVIVDDSDATIVEGNLLAENRFVIQVIASKGLHFKIPFIQNVDIYTAKYLTYKSQEEIINTKDDKRIEIQMYAQYRIIDPVRFKLSVGTKAEANKRMDEIVYKIVIQSANTLNFDQFFNQTTLNELLDNKQIALNAELLESYGIYVTDIGINRKKFPDSNVASVEGKMTLQIEKDSEKLTAEGDSEYLQAQASADREKAEIVATAVEEAAIIKAAADAESNVWRYTKVWKAQQFLLMTTMPSLT
jgi:membrane protease subunit HflC